MNLSNIDLNLLVYFSVLLREGNVTKAAEHLGLKYLMILCWLEPVMA